MSPYDPQAKRLERSTTHKIIGGVCGGVADYLNMDATLVRILTVVISLFTGVPVLVYLVALFVMPQAGASAGTPPFPSPSPAAPPQDPRPQD